MYFILTRIANEIRGGMIKTKSVLENLHVLFGLCMHCYNQTLVSYDEQSSDKVPSNHSLLFSVEKQQYLCE